MPAGVESLNPSVAPTHRWTVGEFLERYHQAPERCWPEFDQDHRALLTLTVIREYRCCKDVAEDLVQECLLKWSLQIPKIESSPIDWPPETPIWPWLRKVCYRDFLDLLKKNRRVTMLSDEEVDSLQEPNKLEDPERLTLAYEALRQCLDCIDGLPLKLREAIELHRIRGETLDAVAKREQVSRQSIFRRIRKGEVRLQNCLRERFGWDECDFEAWK